MISLQPCQMRVRVGCKGKSVSEFQSSWNCNRTSSCRVSSTPLYLLFTSSNTFLPSGGADCPSPLLYKQSGLLKNSLLSDQHITGHINKVRASVFLHWSILMRLEFKELGYTLDS